MEWISTHKVQDLKYLLGDHTTTEDGMAILRGQKKLTLHQGALYHCHTPARGLEEVMWFIVLMAHRVATMNRCQRVTGHQGQQWILSLLQNKFCWPGMVIQMSNQWLWKVYPAQWWPCQGSTTTYSSHFSFRTASHGFHQHWDGDGSRTTTTHCYVRQYAL